MRLSLAPLRGLTVATYRTCYAEYFGNSYDYTVAPFIPLTTAGRIQPKLLKDIFPEVCGTMHTVPQVIGKEPDRLIEMANAMKEYGYNELNLNCGCPWKFVAKKGRGSGLPENPELFEAMLAAGVEVMPGGFSIKIRLGRKSIDTLESLIPIINKYPLQEIIIHPRTGEQMYEGDVFLNKFAEIVDSFAMPVVYNGDIKTVSDALYLLKRFPKLAGLMLGRGAFEDPFLPGDIAAALVAGEKYSEPIGDTLPHKQTLPHTKERKQQVIDFANALYQRYSDELFGPAPILGRMKEFWEYTATYFGNGADILRKVQRSKTLDEYEHAVKLFN